MMIFLSDSMAWRRSPGWSACLTVEPTWTDCLMVSLICLSRMQAVGHHNDGVEYSSVIVLQADELVGEPGNGV